ncbi:MAG: hypothetical protein M1826_007331 [Phylliscum demangeonii]|nr:MAG: hypothetical protein M1826_007331 [Phylliscum demangeonii]
MPHCGERLPDNQLSQHPTSVARRTRERGLTGHPLAVDRAANADRSAMARAICRVRRMPQYGASSAAVRRQAEALTEASLMGRRWVEHRSAEWVLDHPDEDEVEVLADHEADHYARAQCLAVVLASPPTSSPYTWPALPAAPGNTPSQTTRWPFTGMPRRGECLPDHQLSQHPASVARRAHERGLTGHPLAVHRAARADRSAKARALRRVRRMPQYGASSAAVRRQAEALTEASLMGRRWVELRSADWVRDHGHDDDDDHDLTEDDDEPAADHEADHDARAREGTPSFAALPAADQRAAEARTRTAVLDRGWAQRRTAEWVFQHEDDEQVQSGAGPRFPSHFSVRGPPDF